MRDKLRALIEQLRLHGMAEVLDAELARAEREAIPAAEVLLRLLAQEATARRERSLRVPVDREHRFRLIVNTQSS